MRAVKQAGRQRPQAPEFDDPFISFVPAPEIKAWVEAHILNAEGALYNEEHKHLNDVDWECLWAASGFEKQGRHVVGQAEEVAFRAGGWQRLRMEEQFYGWFKRVPDFVLTFSASYAGQCDDIAWCALVEHELYHVGHKQEFGAPAFTRDGRPKVGIRGHDVEEFIGVVRRYGVGPETGNLAQLVRAANRPAEVSSSRIAGACGTCLRLVA